MAVDDLSPALSIRSSVGVELWASAGAKHPFEHKANLPREETKNSRSISFSPEGRYFAYSNGQEIKILETDVWQLRCALPRPKASYVKFSPRGNYLCTWELYAVTKDKPEGSPNMFVYEMASGREVFAIVQKKQTDWEPSWSSDESIFAIVAGGEALFYDLSTGIDGFQTTTRKIGGTRGGSLSLGPGNSPPFLAFYTPGTKGSPSMCKLYKYPALSLNQAIACKSFFQADRVEMLWNKRGTGLLLLTSTEVDKSGASYYGNQALHFMATKGDTCSVPLSKEGPVHCVKWSPKANEFVVVYGFMPSKAALYNLKCDVVYDFGEGPRNCAYFNTFGNIVVLAGFGNLPGNVEIWDVTKKEKLADIKCPDTTYFEWNPNGEYFVTATTAPRLRIGNGFKVYHYSGALMHETMWPEGQELLGVEWQKFPESTFTEPIITKKKQEGIKSCQPEASTKVYTPPHLRLLKEGKNPENYLPQPKATIPGMPAGTSHTSKGTSSKGTSRQNNFKQNKQQRSKKNYGAENGGATATGATITNSNISLGTGVTDIHNLIDDNGLIIENNKAIVIVEQHQSQYQQQNTNRRGPRKKQQTRKLLQSASTTMAAIPNINSSNEHYKIEKKSDMLLQTQKIQQQQHQQQPQQSQQQQLQQQQQQQQQLQSQQQPKKVANPEKDKKIRSVAKKLSDIKKLKARHDQGEILELNQLNKIAMEAKFLEELKALKLSA